MLEKVVGGGSLTCLEHKSFKIKTLATIQTRFLVRCLNGQNRNIQHSKRLCRKHDITIYQH